jgi:hypothetical protein
MRRFILRRLLVYFVPVLIITVMCVGCGNNERWDDHSVSPTSHTLLPTLEPTIQTSDLLTVQPVISSAIQPTPTLFVFGSLFDPSLDLKAGPIALPLELRIPVLNVNAPMMGVGLTVENAMDAPRGPDGDPIWHTAFWYRGSSPPGTSGTATIAGHVDDLLGRPEIFADLQSLKPGDLIIIHAKEANIDIRFKVNHMNVYSIAESSNPAVLAQIYGAGPVAGTGPLPSHDGSAHLTLITCAGKFVNGQFDHHIVVYATRIN